MNPAPPPRRPAIAPLLAASLFAAACGPQPAPADADAGQPDAAADAAVDVAPDLGPPIDAGAHLPPSWSVTAPGITVEVRRQPAYGYTVRDAAGAEVLSTFGTAEPASGYGAVGWSAGRTRYTPNPLNRSYTQFAAYPQQWRDDWAVVEARTPDARTLELDLRSDGGRGAQRMTVTHALRDSTLRVEARVEGATPRMWETAFATPADEGFMGFGERFNRTNQRGVDVYNWAEEGGIGGGEGSMLSATNPYPNGQAMSYYPVPFFISTRGYGFWLDTTWRSEFNLATQRADAWRAWHVGPTLAYEVYVPTPADPRPWPYHLIDRFTAATGRPMVPPAWTYGPRRRISRGDMQGGVSEIQAMRDLDLAITGLDDALHFTPEGSHVGIEAEVRAWTTEGARLGYRMNAYYNSLFSDAADSRIRGEYERALANNWFLRDATGMPSEVVLISGRALRVLQVDFTSAPATQWYQSIFRWATDLGYVGWMQDFGEYVQADSLAANGMTGEELHNLYPVLYDRAVYEAMEASPLRGDWLAFARAGYTGSSQYTPMIWSGDPAASFEDADGLPTMPRGAINMGISGGVNWGGDIGGFHCIADGSALADGEMLTRWIQQGATTPNMMDQDACSGALDDGEKASIWNSVDAQRAWHTYARLHTRLFPYFYALGTEAHATGAPIVRHLFLEHPERRDLAGVDDEYYLGPSLLVAPVVRRGARERAAHFPAGLYLDWRDGTLVRGGPAAQTVSAPLDKLPLYLRDGRLVPMLDASIDTLARETNPAVVGIDDVTAVYDVVGLVSAAARDATFRLADGGTLEAHFTGPFTAPTLAPAATEADLATCAAGCWRRDQLSPGLARVRITAPRDTEVVAGGLRVRATGVARTIRWDLYLAD